MFLGDASLTAHYLGGTTGWDEFATLTGLTPVPGQAPAQANIATCGVQSNHFAFAIHGSSNAVTVVRASQNLAQPIWSLVGSNTLTSGSLNFSDPQWTNYPSRFYRVRSP